MFVAGAGSATAGATAAPAGAWVGLAASGPGPGDDPAPIGGGSVWAWASALAASIAVRTTEAVRRAGRGMVDILLDSWHARPVLPRLALGSSAGGGRRERHRVRRELVYGDLGGRQELAVQVLLIGQHGVERARLGTEDGTQPV